jgi:hypothetical protein
MDNYYLTISRGETVQSRDLYEIRDNLQET